MHPIADLMYPALGKPCWLVNHGYGSFVTMEFGQPQVEISGPELIQLHIEGAPERSPRRFAVVHGDWHLWIYCCRWTLTLNGIQLAHDESDDIAMNYSFQTGTDVIAESALPMLILRAGRAFRLSGSVAVREDDRGRGIGRGNMAA